MLYRGSIPLYDYPLGMRVHPPFIYCTHSVGISERLANNVVELVYNGSTYDGKAIASPSVESRKCKKRKTNAIKMEIEVVSIFNFMIFFLKN